MYKPVYLTRDNHFAWQNEAQIQAAGAELAISFRVDSN